MKLRLHAATASVLIATGSAAAQPAIVEPVYPVMVMTHNPAVNDKLRRSILSCVELAQAGKFEAAMPFCNMALRHAEHGTPGTAVDISLEAAAARSNRAVVSWLLGRDERAAADMAVAVAQSPGASFVRKNMVVMGMEPPATTLAAGPED